MRFILGAGKAAEMVMLVIAFSIVAFAAFGMAKPEFFASERVAHIAGTGIQVMLGCFWVMFCSRSTQKKFRATK